ncbi:MAG TPA: hypothetical protein DDW52_16980 [Planctomycetaceae bacterium]|nr:hypothetical protein [Planctomycetaceae bacterium]
MNTTKLALSTFFVVSLICRLVTQAQQGGPGSTDTLDQTTVGKSEPWNSWKDAEPGKSVLTPTGESCDGEAAPPGGGGVTATLALPNHTPDL